MANIPRAAALAMFRIHIENGLSVAVGVGLTGLLAGWVLGFNAAIAAATGAVCVSISDQPDPLRLKPWILGWALAIAVTFTALTGFTQFLLPPYGLVALVVLTGLWTGLISAYGKRALILSMTGVLTFVYAMGRHFQTVGDTILYLELFTGGALLYALYDGLFALLLDDRARRLLLAEAMRGFAIYLRAKAALYNPDTEGPAALRRLIDAHAALIDRLQAARDAIFSRRDQVIQKKRIDSLIALLDAFETMLSSDADFELLRRSERRDLKRRIHDFILLIAEEVEGLTLVLRSRHARVSPQLHRTEDRELVDAVKEANRDHAEDEATDHAFFVTANKLVLADSHVAALARTLDWKTPPSALSGELDLNLFQQSVPQGLGVLAQQFDLNKPACRASGRDRSGDRAFACLCRCALSHHRGGRLDLLAFAAPFLRAFGPSAILGAGDGHADRRGAFLCLQFSSAALGAQRSSQAGQGTTDRRPQFRRGGVAPDPSASALSPGAQADAGRRGTAVPDHPPPGRRTQHQPPHPGVVERTSKRQLRFCLGPGVDADPDENPGQRT
jgi:hypothetical protein